MKLIMENWRGYLDEEEQVQFNTMGDLRKAVDQAVLARRKGQAAVGAKNIGTAALLDLVPGAATAKSVFDVVKSIVALPDSTRSKTSLDILNVDDKVSAIVDDDIENAFLSALEKELKAYPDDTPLQNLDMTKLLGKYIAREYEKRTVVAPKKEG